VKIELKLGKIHRFLHQNLCVINYNVTNITFGILPTFLLDVLYCEMNFCFYIMIFATEPRAEFKLNLSQLSSVTEIYNDFSVKKS